jgi:hypothetical protein
MHTAPTFSEQNSHKLAAGKLFFINLPQHQGPGKQHLAISGAMASAVDERVVFILDRTPLHDCLQVLAAHELIGNALVLEDDWTVKLSTAPGAWQGTQGGSGTPLVLLSQDGDAGYYLQGSYCDANGYSSTLLLRLKDGLCYETSQLSATRSYCSDWEIYLNLPGFGLQRLHGSSAQKTA